MSNTEYSLQRRFPRYFLIPAALVLSAATLGMGLFLPVISFKELVFWKHTFSVLGGIESLASEGHWVLGAIVFLFSIVFPLFKLTVLFAVWFLKLTDNKRKEFIHVLGITGKWSMLDVFVVAMTIVIAKISNFASAEPRLGIYFFCFSIMLAMIVTIFIEKLIKRGDHA